jgi:hypothetical protein
MLGSGKTPFKSSHLEPYEVSGVLGTSKAFIITILSKCTFKASENCGT